jgi:hypothetical protein
VRGLMASAARLTSAPSPVSAARAPASDARTWPAAMAGDARLSQGTHSRRDDYQVRSGRPGLPKLRVDLSEQGRVALAGTWAGKSKASRLSLTARAAMASPLPAPAEPRSTRPGHDHLATAQTLNRPHTARWSPVPLVTFS